jgi:Fungal specific transcription factor domain
MASPLMMNPRKEWFSLAIQDHALFHVALSHAAGNLSLLLQKGDSVESLVHRMEAIRIINERLNDLGCGISDGTVGAVASMASYEVSNFLVL